MDAITSEQARIVIETGRDMRVGRKLKRTLYVGHPYLKGPDNDICVGIVDSEAIASQIVALWNDHAADVRLTIEEDYGE